MKKIKKVLAMIMAMAMIMGLGMTAFAAPSTEKATATVKGVTEDGAVVTAYQLVYYDDETQEYVVDPQLAEYGYVVGMDNADVVSDIASAVAAKNITLQSSELNDTGDDYTAELTAGTYLVLVTGSGDTIYNPMLVSLKVTYPDGIQDGEVDADGAYIVENETVYAKSTDDVPVDKIITDADGVMIGTNGKYDDVYAGTEVYFKITGTIPSYSDQYDNNSLTYKLTDTVSEGLDLAENLQDTLQAQLGTAATVTVEGRTITIDYTNEYILNHGGEQVVIKYSATINGQETNFDAATNTVYVEYSNSPSSTTKGDLIETNHYTFDLEQEIVKVDANNEATKLEGAVFTLTSTTDSEKVFTGTSDAEGFIKFEGLDAGTYTLVETKAPDGYQLSDEVYTVEINPVYGADNELESYTVTIKDSTGAAIGGFEYTEGNQVGTGDAADIKNTTLSSLPSTGGIGTTIFTIGGIVIMVAAAGLYFANRRKNNAE